MKVAAAGALAAGAVLALCVSRASADPTGSAVTGDGAKGEAVYARCLACHSLTYDRTGPRHCGLFGRRAGSVKEFSYSDAMKRSKIVWNEKTLDRFLADPLKIVPGTSMGYAGIKDQKERADLIAFLKRENSSVACGKSAAAK